MQISAKFSMKICCLFQAAIFAAAAGPAIAQQNDCSFLKRDPLELRDTQLFYRLPNGTAWVALEDGNLSPVGATFSGQKLEFAYVVRESLDPKRDGVVIVKSGRKRQPNESAATPATSQVQLVRKYSSSAQGDDRVSDNGTCGAIASFGNGGERAMSASAYDEYHAIGRTTDRSEQSAIKSFHHSYVGRDRRCKTTSNGDEDSREPLIRRSNRGQFSFDPGIVNDVTSSQVASVLPGSTAIASELPVFADRRIELKRYSVGNTVPTCVRFVLAVPANAGFVRINDLEGLQKRGVYYIRADEKSWSAGP